jgi:fumarylpyruvate hydrolase
LVIALGKGGSFVAPEDALALVWGYAAGNDLTRRDLQAAAKTARRPWDMSKGFDNSAVVGAIRPGATVPTGRIRCLLDSKTTQDADLADMIWPVADIIAHLSRLVDLKAGDLIFTGTPAGVGPILRDQTCQVLIDGLEPATVTIR